MFYKIAFVVLVGGFVVYIIAAQVFAIGAGAEAYVENSVQGGLNNLTHMITGNNLGR